MREKGQNEVAKTLETPVFSRGREILTEKIVILSIFLTLAINIGGAILFFVILYLVIKTAVKKGMIEAHREIHSTKQEPPYE